MYQSEHLMNRKDQMYCPRKQWVMKIVEAELSTVIAVMNSMIMQE